MKLREKFDFGEFFIAVEYCSTNLLGISMLYMRFWGQRVIGISGYLIWSKTLMELIFNPCGEFR